MRIIVDKMPKSPEDCTYSKTTTYMGMPIKSVCIWHTSDHECLSVDNCPYFVTMRGLNE